MVVGNKSDMRDPESENRYVTKEEGQRLARVRLQRMTQKFIHKTY